MKPSTIDRNRQTGRVRRVPRPANARVVALLVGLLLMLMPAAASAAVLGSPNLGGYCNFKHRTNVLFSAGPLNLFSAYSWRCTLPSAIPVDGIDVNAACRLQYGGGAYGFTTNPGWARRLVGLEDYVTNIGVALMPANEVIASYPPALNPEVEAILNALQPTNSRH